jgi:hypothetical protein
MALRSIPVTAAEGYWLWGIIIVSDAKNEWS